MTIRQGTQNAAGRSWGKTRAQPIVQPSGLEPRFPADKLSVFNYQAITPPLQREGGKERREGQREGGKEGRREGGRREGRNRQKTGQKDRMEERTIGRKEGRKEGNNNPPSYFLFQFPSSPAYRLLSIPAPPTLVPAETFPRICRSKRGQFLLLQLNPHHKVVVGKIKGGRGLSEKDSTFSTRLWWTLCSYSKLHSQFPFHWPPRPATLSLLSPELEHGHVWLPLAEPSLCSILLLLTLQEWPERANSNTSSAKGIQFVPEMLAEVPVALRGYSARAPAVLLQPGEEVEHHMKMLGSVTERVGRPESAGLPVDFTCQNVAKGDCVTPGTLWPSDEPVRTVIDWPHPPAIALYFFSFAAQLRRGTADSRASAILLTSAAVEACAHRTGC
ncbi:hypothetical protein L345_05879, partial [Ophiophagus hannah]